MTDTIVDARNRKYRKCELCGKNRKAEVRASRSANGKKCAGNLVHTPAHQKAAPFGATRTTDEAGLAAAAAIAPAVAVARNAAQQRQQQEQQMPIGMAPSTHRYILGQRKKKKFVDGPALQMGRTTKTVCLDTAIIRCQPAQEDADRSEFKKMREAHSGLSNRRWKKVFSFSKGIFIFLHTGDISGLSLGALQVCITLVFSEFSLAVL